MKRRELLAVGAAIAIAGCSDETSEPNQTDVADTNDDESGDENGAEQTSNGEGDEGLSNGESEEIDNDDGPTDEELAVEAISDAQQSLSSAVQTIDDQEPTEADLGEKLSATVSISTTPVRDDLSHVRDAIGAARDLELTDEQGQTIDAIESAEAALRKLISAYSSFDGLQSKFDYILEDVHDGNLERATDDAVELERAAEVIGDDVGNLRDLVNDLEEGAFESVNALAVEDIAAELKRLESEVDAAGSVGAAIDPLAAAEEAFWPAYKPLQAEEFEDVDESALRSPVEDYEAAADAVKGTDAPTFGTDAGRVDTFTEAMAEVAYRASRIANRHENGFHKRADEHSDKFTATLETAVETDVRDLSEFNLNYEYDMREHSNPVFDFDAEWWQDGDTIYVEGEVTNTTPYAAKAEVGPAPYEEDGSPSLDIGSTIEVEIDSGETWKPNEPWEINNDHGEWAGATLDAWHRDWVN